MLHIEGDDRGRESAICRFTGPCDGTDASDLRHALADRGPLSHLVLDLSAVSFIDSAGLGGLLSAAHHARDDDGDVTVVCDRLQLLGPLRLVGFDRLARIVPPSGDDDGLAGR